MQNEHVLAKGVSERIGQDRSVIKHTAVGKERFETSIKIKTHLDAVKLVLDTLKSPEYGAIKDLGEVSAVGHRVAHGGETFSEATLIDNKVLKAIQDNIGLAPLHNPANIMGIEACMQIIHNTPMVAVFDTAFHQSMPEEAFMYALPCKYYEKYGIRRYGFHGTSHKYVSQRAAFLVGKDISSLNIISCHLGNGSSIAAIKSGKSIDTSMGFTPLEGLPMGTRCGSIDPAIISFLIEKENLDTEQINYVLNKSSGMLGISGISSDFRDLEAASVNNARAELAIRLFSYSIKKYIGAYTAVLGGVDCLIFTAGIGENSKRVRKLACSGLDCIGIKVDNERNNCVDGISYNEGVISTSDSAVKIFVIPANEELMIARETAALI
jgi:acetate kinase